MPGARGVKTWEFPRSRDWGRPQVLQPLTETRGHSILTH